MRFTIYDLRFTSQRASVHNHLVSAFRFPLSAFAGASLVVLIFLLGGGIGHTQTNSYGVRVGTNGALVSPANFFQANGVLTNNQVGATLSGTFSGNGAGLTNVPGAGGGGNTYAIGNSNASAGQTFVVNGTNFFVGTNTTGLVSTTDPRILLGLTNAAAFDPAGAAQAATNGITGSARLNPSSIITNNYAPDAIFNGQIGQAENLPSYLQLYTWNQNPYGSADHIVINDLGTPTSTNWYGDFGINGSLFSGFMGGPGDVYLYSAASNLLFATTFGNTRINFSAGNFGVTNTAYIDAFGLTSSGGVTAAYLAGNGSAITGVNAATATNAAVGGNIVTNNTPGGIVLGGTFSGAFSGNGSGLTNLQASGVSGTFTNNTTGASSVATNLASTSFTLTLGAGLTGTASLSTSGAASLALTNTSLGLPGTVTNNASYPITNNVGYYGNGSGLTNLSWPSIIYSVATSAYTTNTVSIDDDSQHVATNDNRALSLTNVNSTIVLSNLFASGFITTHTNLIGAGLLTNAMIAGLIGSNQVCILQTNNASPGELQFLSVNAQSNTVQLANIKLGTVTANVAAISQVGSFALTGNLTGNTATTGTVACTNVTATNLVAWTVMIPTNRVPVLTNTLADFRNTNQPIQFSTNDATGLTVYDRQFIASTMTVVNRNMGNLVATNVSTSTAAVGKATITNLNVALVVMPYTNLAIFDGSRGCQFLYTNTTNPLIFFTNMNVGTIYSLDIIQTNSGASGGPWFFTNFQGGFSNSFVCWPNGVVQTPATNFGGRSHYTLTGLPGYGAQGTNVIITGAITNY